MKKTKYQKYLASNEWSKTRRGKLNTTPRRCAICGDTNHLDVHHLNYKHLHDVSNCDMRILCRRCHFLSHDLQKQGLIVYKSDNHHHRFAVLKNAVKKAMNISHKNLFYP